MDTITRLEQVIIILSTQHNFNGQCCYWHKLCFFLLRLLCFLVTRPKMALIVLTKRKKIEVRRNIENMLPIPTKRKYLHKSKNLWHHLVKLMHQKNETEKKSKSQTEIKRNSLF